MSLHKIHIHIDLKSRHLRDAKIVEEAKDALSSMEKRNKDMDGYLRGLEGSLNQAYSGDRDVRCQEMTVSPQVQCSSVTSP